MGCACGRGAEPSTGSDRDRAGKPKGDPRVPLHHAAAGSDQLFLAARFLRAGLRAADFFAAARFLGLRAADFFAVLRFAGLRAADFFAVRRFAGLRAADFFAVLRFAGLRAAVFFRVALFLRAELFLAVDFFAAARFLGLRAAAFLAGAFLAELFFRALLFRFIAAAMLSPLSICLRTPSASGVDAPVRSSRPTRRTARRGEARS
jgi:hypothetical protein